MTLRVQSKFDYQALAQFRYEIRRFINFSEQAARAAGVEPQQHQALLAIKGLPGAQKATVGVLAERLQVQHHSAVELVNRLEAHGLLRRARSRADRREVLLALTPRGAKLLKELSLPHLVELRAAGTALLQALQAIARAPSHPRAMRRKSGLGRKLRAAKSRTRRN
ncbi:MAG TPA: helix-turn-helix domain-containing protein [Candidatus Acidoferrales bacterium]|nr:helix-turn-helix domain-containing protein [Candidatus Acidoferrales bacterium]